MWHIIWNNQDYYETIFQGSGEEENKKEEKAEEDEGRGRPGENAK